MRKDQAVQQYFDAIAEDYAGRYQSSNAYYRYFFNERLEAATAGIDFEGKKILDIGAGTGALYDWLQKNTTQFHYFGTDISSRMFDASQIPSHLRFSGDVTQAPLPHPFFDYIFMLGVTSYMQRDEFDALMDFLPKRLTSEGKIIVSFTNRGSLDYWFRRLLRMVKPTKTGRRIIGQDFTIQGYRLKDLQAISENMDYQTPVWLNQTLSPFNHFLPGPSVWFAKLLQKSLSQTRLLPILSADFLIRLSKP